MRVDKTTEVPDVSPDTTSGVDSVDAGAIGKKQAFERAVRGQQRMTQITDALEPGQIARVRQRTYLVEEVVKPRRLSDSTLVRLSCVDDDNQGQQLEVLWEKELDPQILTGDLVTSGPETQGITNRDTSVVVRELFAHAQESVLVVGYAVYQGQHVFEALAKRMEESPDLDVQFFLNISRPDQDTTASDILVSRFTQRFKQSQWPVGCRLPEVYYDPRSVSDEEPVRSSLHAKCVVVDHKHVFVSSANFTEAGQERNIEVGLSIKSPWLAKRLVRHFRLLCEHGLALRAF